MSSARGLRFTFTPHQGWSTSAKSPVKPDGTAASSTPSPAPNSASPAALLSISPTIGFESATHTALPPLVSPRAHVSLTRCTSAPPATPSPLSKRRRHTDRSQRQYTDSEEDDRWSYAAASECREEVDGDVEEESVDVELSAITSRPLSILVSPLCIRERPHCPIPLSPAEVDTPSLSSLSSASTAPSPRRPLFVNHIVAADQRRTSPRLNAANNRPSTAPSSAAFSISSTSMPPLTSFSLSVPSTPSTPLSSFRPCTTTTTPSSSSSSSTADLSSPSLTAACRTRSQWRRFRLGGASEEQASRSLYTDKRTPPRRIIPTLLHDTLKPAIVLPSAPLEERSLSTGSARQHTSPKRSVSIPSSPPPPAPSSSNKRHKTAATRVSSDNKSQSMRRSWSRGEQTSMHDYLTVA